MDPKLFRKKKSKQKEIAAERINELFKQAKIMFKENKEFSRKYIQLARKISMKYNVRIPEKLRRKYCKKCSNYLVEGKNLKIRVKDGKLVRHCLDCKSVSRIPFK